ncbi:MAG: DASS family sodium-coupled anion symporter [Hyphomonadaceae bacterium]
MRAGNIKRITLWLGPALALGLQLFPAPEGLSSAGWGVASLLLLMAVWWATEPIPIPATSLLPLVVLPLIDAGNAREVAAGYSHPIVLLLLGGFIIALGIERWGLHKRIALNVVAAIGSSPGTLILGFMLATAALSMWISNTATTLMMVPIAISAAAALKDESGKFTTALLLGVCYAASIGGIATPIGTPTNLIAIGWLTDNTGAGISFWTWMKFGIPAVILLVPAAWWSVTRGLPRLANASEAISEVHRQRGALGPMTTPERRVAIVFGLVALMWMTRTRVQGLAIEQGWDFPSLLAVNDMSIAIAGAVAMFLVPAGRGEDRAGRALLNWDEAVKLPWGVLLLFGGGITLGQAVTRTGLSTWLGEQLAGLSTLPPIFFIAVVVAMVIFLTELTSNVATMTTLAPVLGVLATAVGIAPASLLAPAAVAASCAFMLPVATAPNAIIYSTDKVTIAQMMKAGLRVNLIGIAIITAVGFWIAPAVLG